MKAISFLHPALAVVKTKKRGRGVFSTSIIDANIIIERSPVIVMNSADRKLLDQTLLHDYIFEWGDDKSQCCMALGYVPLYNHAFNSNCEYEMDFKKGLISIKTMRAIEPGEELFINYNGDWDNNNPLWFDAR